MHIDPDGRDYYLNLYTGLVEHFEGSEDLFDKGYINVGVDGASFGDIEDALTSFGYSYNVDPNVKGGFVVNTNEAYKAWSMMQVFSPDNVGAVLFLASSGELAKSGVKKISSSLAKSTGGKATVSAAKGSHSVYQSMQNGTTEYVGITKNFMRRAGEHLRKGRIIRELISNLSPQDARAVEQALIEINGLAKNGGTLTNKINSIAPSNPAYAEQLKRGYEILKTIGY